MVVVEVVELAWRFENGADREAFRLVRVHFEQIALEARP